MGSRFWAVRHEGNGNYFMTTRGYADPLNALKQITSKRGNKAYAGRRQHVNQFLNMHGMLNSKINNNALRALVLARNRNLYNRIVAARTLQTIH